MSAGTERRTVRVEDDLWDAAGIASKARGDDRSYLIRQALHSYVIETWGLLVSGQIELPEQEALKLGSYYGQHIEGDRG